MSNIGNDTGGEGKRSGAPSTGYEQPPATDVSLGAGVLESLRALPGGNELLAVASGHDGEVELVGGSVRDIALGSLPRELDVVVAGSARAFAEELARRLSPSAVRQSDEHVQVTYHERFQTALVRWDSGEIDVAMRRGETYPAPGALPEVAPGSARQDLERRDFTVNAIAVVLAGEQAGQLRSVEGALDDLIARRLRVLHDTSFSDDPTRILRLVRYAARLGFEIEPHTAELLAAAIAGGALRTLSGQRLGAELRLAFAEDDPLEPLAELERLGVLRAWQPGVSFDRAVVSTALRLLPEDGSRRLMLAASLLLELSRALDREDTEPLMLGFLEDLEMPAGKGKDAFGVAVNAVCIADYAGSVETISDLLELMVGAPVESFALAAAIREQEEGPGSYGRAIVEDWLERQRYIELQITGDDLLAAGVPEGREIGMRLDSCYRLLLEESIEPGRESELRAALEARI
jgi:tRNA nucleotidyltransferase (CCA-adding enzyme)